MRPSKLFAFFLAAFCFHAQAEIIGTFQGGFNTGSSKVAIELRCANPSKCELRDERTHAGDFDEKETYEYFELVPLGGCTAVSADEWTDCDPTDWTAATKAIAFAKRHKQFVESETAEILNPFLHSEADIKRCFSVDGAMNFKWAIICEITDSPWNRPAVLYLEPQFSPCTENAFHCTFRFLPLFKTSEDAVIRSRTRGQGFPKYSGPPPAQKEVQDYVNELKSRINARLQIPDGAPRTVTLDYEITFDQETGRVINTRIKSGCHCPKFRYAIHNAVNQAAPLPLLPQEKQHFLGKRIGYVYLQATTKQP